MFSRRIDSLEQEKVQIISENSTLKHEVMKRDRAIKEMDNLINVKKYTA
jgi:hypothetical protein